MALQSASTTARERHHWRGRVTLRQGPVAASWRLLNSDGDLTVFVANAKKDVCQWCNKNKRILDKSWHALWHLNVRDMYKCRFCDYHSRCDKKRVQQHALEQHPDQQQAAAVISREEEFRRDKEALLDRCFPEYVDLFTKRLVGAIERTLRTLRVEFSDHSFLKFSCNSKADMDSFQAAVDGLTENAANGDDGEEEEDEEVEEEEESDNNDEDEEQNSDENDEDDSSSGRSSSPSPSPPKRAKMERDAEEPSPPLNSTTTDSAQQLTQEDRLEKNFDCTNPADWDYCLIECSSDDEDLRRLIRVSEALLMRCSPTVLGAMLKDKLGEHPTITIDGFSYKDVRAMARFCQTQLLKAGDDVATLLQMAIKFDIGDLKHACIGHLLVEMSPLNAVKLLIVAEEVKEEALKTAAIDLIVANFDEVKKTADYPLLKEKLLFELLDRLSSEMKK